MGANGIYGLSGSGLDIESMVKVGMISKQQEYDKMYTKYVKNEWKKNEYLSLYGEIQTFNNSTLSQYKMSANMNARVATSADTSVVTATANATAGTITHYAEVTQLASSAYLIGTKLERENDEAKNQSLLSSVFLKNIEKDPDDNTKISVTYADGTTESVDAKDTAFLFALRDGKNGDLASTDSDVVVAKAAPDVETGTHKVEVTNYDATNGATIKIDDGSEITVTTKDTDGNYVYEDGGGITYTIKAAGSAKISNTGAQNVKITYQELLDGFTLNDLTAKINGMGMNVRASYDSVSDRISFYNKNSGKDNTIEFEIANGQAGTNTAKFFESLGLNVSTNGTSTALSTTDMVAGGKISLAGQNSQVKIDGIDYDLDSNKITVDGVTYNFVNETQVGSKVAISITQDTEAIVKKVQSFVDDYNALMTKLYKWYDEQPNSDYKPLTDSQKAGMKEEQIEKWEEKAKAGLLYHDEALGNIITELRTAIAEKVEGISGKYNTIFSLGVSTTGIKGQLTLDTAKLNQVLSEDPDAVYNVFAKLDKGETQYLMENEQTGARVWLTDRYAKGYTVVNDADGNPKTQTIERNSYNGIANRISSLLMTGMKNVRSISGSSAEISEDSELNNLLRELQTKMSNFKKFMSAFESKLYKKYDAMESSLSLLGTQLNYVTSAFQ